MDSGTRRNVATNYVNFVIVALLGFIVNPLLLSALGPLQFGIWKSLQRYLDFATVADGRASQALKWIVASRSALTEVERRRDIGAAITVWLRWLPVAAIMAGGVTAALPLLIKGIPPETESIAYTTAAILAANTILAGLLSVPDSVLTGVNQGYKSMIVTTVAFIGSNVAMVIVAFLRWPLWSLAVVVLVTAVANCVFTLFVARRAVPWWGIAKPSAADVRRVFGYSTWTLGSMVVDKLFLATELIIISVALGAIVVTQYTFTTYLMQFVISIGQVTASGFMPLLGSHLGSLDVDAAAERAKSVRHLVIGISALGGAAVLAFNSIFIGLWVGAEQYLGTTMNALLVVSGLQFALIRMDGQILDVTMRMGPKVLFGLLSSAGGIAAGCFIYSNTHSLVQALVGVIVLRLICSIAYPMLVSRSIPHSGQGVRSIVLAVILLVYSLIMGPVIAGRGLVTTVAIGAAWVVVAGSICWVGLIPRHTVGALLAGRRSSA